MSYSVDLRERVISFVENGSSKSAASRLFNVSVFSIDAWLKKKSLLAQLKMKNPRGAGRRLIQNYWSLM